MLSKLGTHMYWNNLWLDNFNKKIFLNKTLFIENILHFMFSEKIFKFFFTRYVKKYNISNPIFKSILLSRRSWIKVKGSTPQRKLKRVKRRKVRRPSYNFSRVWFIKFNNYILFTTFVFSYFKLKSKLKKKNIFKKIKFKKIKIKTKKKSRIFLKRRRGHNFKRRLLFRGSCLLF